MEMMIVDSNACNDVCFTALALSLFSNLKVFEVGDYSFAFVEEVKLIGLNQLERVEIGKNSFAKKKNDKANAAKHLSLHALLSTIITSTF